MAKPRKKTFEKLLDPRQAAYSSYWALADRYRITGGNIYPDPQGSEIKFHHPLMDPDLLLSFARLGAGDRLSEGRIQDWVSKHGLLTRKNDNTLSPVIPVGKGGREVNQGNIRVDDFKKEVACANGLLNLVADIRDENTTDIRDRFHRASEGVGAPYFTDLDRTMADLHKHRQRVADHLRPRWAWVDDPDDSLDLYLAGDALMGVLQAKMAAIQMTFGDHYFVGLKPRGSDFRPTGAFYCPDLLTAIYAQLYLWITDHRPMRRCNFCGTPFIASRKDRKWCGDSCKSMASSYTKEGKPFPAYL